MNRNRTYQKRGKIQVDTVRLRPALGRGLGNVGNVILVSYSFVVYTEVKMINDQHTSLFLNKRRFD